MVEQTLRAACEAAAAAYTAKLQGVARAAPLPSGDALAAAERDAEVEAEGIFLEQGGSLAKKQLPGPWRQKLAKHCREEASREAATLAAASAQLCRELAARLIQARLQGPVHNGAFDRCVRKRWPSDCVHMFV